MDIQYFIFLCRWKSEVDPDFEILGPELIIIAADVTSSKSGIYRCDVMSRHNPPEEASANMRLIVFCKYIHNILKSDIPLLK